MIYDKWADVRAVCNGTGNGHKSLIFAAKMHAPIYLSQSPINEINPQIHIRNMRKALVLYHSQQYGNTEKMATAVADGLSGEGCAVTLHNSNTKRYLIEEYGTYDLVAFGTPDYFSYMAGTLKTFLDDWYLHRNEPGFKGKPYALFMSHGGGGRAKDTLTVFRHLGTQVGELVSSSGAPSDAIRKQCRELGKQLAKA